MNEEPHGVSRGRKPVTDNVKGKRGGPSETGKGAEEAQCLWKGNEQEKDGRVVLTVLKVYSIKWEED